VDVSSRFDVSGFGAIVTGGASGLGLAYGEVLAAHGARVTLIDVDADGAAAQAERLRSEGLDVRAAAADVTDHPALDRAIDEAARTYGRLDVAFANAGTGAFAPIVDTDAADWMRVIEVNLLGPLLTVKHAARRMPGGGSIVMTASLNAVQPAAGMSAYCCSKAALAMLAEVAALELGASGVRVNAIGPGLVRTGLTEGMWAVPGVVEDFDENAPLSTTTSPDDVAKLVAFLASDDASSISGCFYLIDRAAHTRRYPDMPAHFRRAFGG